MLTDIKSWEKIVSDMGIRNEDQIIIYDNSDVISSCRCWYNFIYFGHDPSLVHVLDGGLKKWINEKKPTVSNLTKTINSNYIANEKKELVKIKNKLMKILIKMSSKLLMQEVERDLRARFLNQERD